MSSPVELNALGLCTTAQSLMIACRRTQDLEDALTNAGDELRANTESKAALRRELGAQARLKGRALVILVDGYAATVPLPEPSMENTDVAVSFTKPYGFNAPPPDGQRDTSQ